MSAANRVSSLLCTPGDISILRRQSVAVTIALSVTEHGDVAGGTVKSSDRPRNTLASARELRPIRPARHGEDRVPALALLETSSLSEKRRSRLGKSRLRNP